MQLSYQTPAVSARANSTITQKIFSPMLVQVLSVGSIAAGVVVVTGYAFYRQGQKISRQQVTTLQSQVEALDKKLMDAEGVNAKLTAKHNRLLSNKLYVRDAKTGRMGHYQEAEEFLNEG
jgi:outer membrane murein-binding lipoprotein Lpp